MSEDSDLKIMGLNPDILLMLRDVQKQKDSGKEIDPETEEALKAIDIASKVVNTIMNGNQIDPVFLKEYIDETTSRLNQLTGINNSSRGKVRKKRKFKKTK